MEPRLVDCGESLFTSITSIALTHRIYASLKRRGDLIPSNSSLGVTHCRILMYVDDFASHIKLLSPQKAGVW